MLSGVCRVAVVAGDGDDGYPNCANRKWNMLIHKLRLQHGWSQEQLAELSGLSVRTIQRAEQGKPASAETLKSLGAVFNVPFQELRNSTMTNTSDTTNVPSINADETLALYRVRKIKRFYFHIAQYVVVIAILAAINLYIIGGHYLWFIWPALGWGLGLVFHGLRIFGSSPFFNAAWERQQVEKILGRKL